MRLITQVAIIALMGAAGFGGYMYWEQTKAAKPADGAAAPAQRPA